MAPRGPRERTRTRAAPERVGSGEGDGGSVPLSAILVLAAGMALFLPAFVGAVEYQVVLSSSMAPALEAGDLAVVTHTDPEDVEVGDVLVFRDPNSAGNLVSHRVVGIQEAGDIRVFQTKGDNLEEPDPYSVKGPEVVGTVSGLVPDLGWAIQAFQQHRTLVNTALLVVPATVLVAKESRNVLRHLRGEAPPEGDPDPSPSPPREVRPRRLAAIVAAVGLPLIALSAPFLAASGPAETGGVSVAGPVGGTAVAVGGDLTYPRYSEIPPGGSADVPDGTGYVAATPDPVPVFWAVGAAGWGPYAPALLTFLLPTVAAPLLLHRLWRVPVEEASPEDPEATFHLVDGPDPEGPAASADATAHPFQVVASTRDEADPEGTVTQTGEPVAVAAEA